jgi:hypothetical protein
MVHSDVNNGSTDARVMTMTSERRPDFTCALLLGKYRYIKKIRVLTMLLLRRQFLTVEDKIAPVVHTKQTVQ